MADNKSTPPAGDTSLEALPIQKPGPIVYVVGGGMILALVGILLFALSGGDSEEQKAQKEQAAEAQVKSGLTLAEQKEQQAHLQKTQAAIAAAQQAEEQEKKAAPQTAPEPEPAAVAPAPQKEVAKQPASSKPASAPASQKKLDSLDALGADITSALK